MFEQPKTMGQASMPPPNVSPQATAGKVLFYDPRCLIAMGVTKDGEVRIEFSSPIMIADLLILQAYLQRTINSELDRFQVKQ